MLNTTLFGVQMKLVICEKNIAARRIAYILSAGKLRTNRLGKVQLYTFDRDGQPWGVIGLKGHIITLDYPQEFRHWNKNPPRSLINIEPVKKVSEHAIASALKSLAPQIADIIIATDFDREGELIGVEALDLVKQYIPHISMIKRAKFSAITNSEVEHAFTQLVDVDYNLSNAGETRQVIDLVWGSVLTRFISLTSSQLGKDFLSIGRVQSPTLALLVEREKEIMNFKPKTFWQIIARLKKDSITFSASHSNGKFWDKEAAHAIYNKIKESETATVIDLKKEVKKEYPPPPFSTTTFLQAASALGFSAAKAMSIAEDLYMAGLISYPRTDNTVYPPSLNLRAIVEKLRHSGFSKEVAEIVANPRKSPTRGRIATTDHPPIHPVNSPTSGRLSSEQHKIYELVCRRFLATLAQDALSEIVDATFTIAGERFIASGYRVIEAHWKTIYDYYKEKRKPLPELSKNEHLAIAKINLTEEQTKPPARYSQGALIAKMEQLSLGTKSTRHEIISKLYSRKYLIGSPPRPTQTAIAVIDSLGECNVTKPDMTAVLEKDMNEIADGKKTLQDTVQESRTMLSSVMESLEQEKDSIRTNIREALKEQKHIGVCPKCGKDMVIRISKKGKRFVGCTNFPKCNNTYSLPQKGSVIRSDRVCSTCNAPIVTVLLPGKKKWELCLNSDCPTKKKNAKPDTTT
jgi:DNA topoisomerase-1